MARRGTFIVIEGTDGSGKGTQFKLLRDRLQMAGYTVRTFDFPQYDQPSSYFVQRYLNGEYGSADAIGPYTASLFYALDRYEAASAIRTALDEGNIVLCNRFTGSSMGHQGGKFSNAEQRRGYFIWLDNLEFEMLRIPRPDVSFVLRVPADIAETLIDKKGERSYTDKKRDIHEADHRHLENALAVYDDMCRLFPKDFQRIDCVRNGVLLDVETVQHMLWQKVMPLLPPPPQIEMPMPAAPAATAPAPAVTSPVTHTAKASGTATAPQQSKLPANDRPLTPSPQPAAPSESPKPYITDTAGALYAFTDVLPPQVVATVMATLHRSSGILSTAVLKAFNDAAHKDATFLARVLKDYGDAGTQRLVSQQVVITGASALLAQKIASAPGTACTEPYVAFLRPELKQPNGRYRYLVPASLTVPVARQYVQHMDRIYDHYAALLSKLIAHLEQVSDAPQDTRTAEWKADIEAVARQTLHAIVPIANTATIAVYASAQAFEDLIVRLLGDEVPEAQRTGGAMLRELRAVIPAFMRNTDQPTGGGRQVLYQANTQQAVKSFAAEQLPETYAPQTEPVQLTDVWPRNELDIVPHMLYAHSNLPFAAIHDTVQQWPYDRKIDAFEAYIGHRQNWQDMPGSALQKVRYTWDVVTSFHTFRNIQQARITNDMHWQQLTPRGGYEVPRLIEDAGLSDEFEDCFDIGLALHSLLQQAGYVLEAQYATLSGHRLRWQLAYNAQQAFRMHEAHTSARTSSETHTLITRMHERIADIHPLIADALTSIDN